MNNLRLFYSENTCQVHYEKDNLCIYLRESEQGSAPVILLLDVFSMNHGYVSNMVTDVNHGYKYIHYGYVTILVMYVINELKMCAECIAVCYYIEWHCLSEYANT